ncbi:MAG TPA: SRPBCC family protein [Trueperaceae bacterium]|nr:SRPBCC family protein [Trueperaceae bacterium]
MAAFDESIDVHVPVREAYTLFRQFERFPAFMEGVEEVRREGADRLYWRANIAGRDEEWEARVVADEPDTRIAWESLVGARNAGEVRFDKVDENTTRIHLHVEYEPEGFVENVGTALGLVNGRTRGDLQRFKEMAEGGAVTSGWHDPADRSVADAERDRMRGEAERAADRQGPATTVRTETDRIEPGGPTDRDRY